MQLRKAFVLDVLEVLERDHGGELRARLSERLPERLADQIDRSDSNSNGPSDLLSLRDAEELLLAIDGAAGDGSGRALESAATDLFSRALSRDASVVVPGDLFGTIARMQARLEQPFVGMPILFELKRTDTGLSLTVGVPGYPRSAKLLRAIGTGAIHAAQRFCREADADELKLHAETLGDRANVTARYRQAVDEVAESLAPNSQAPKPRRQRTIAQPHLSLEVERILSRPPSAEDADTRHPAPISARPEPSLGNTDQLGAPTPSAPRGNARRPRR